MLAPEVALSTATQQRLESDQLTQPLQFDSIRAKLKSLLSPPTVLLFHGNELFTVNDSWCFPRTVNLSLQ